MGTSPTGLFPDQTFPRRIFTLVDISPIIIYYWNFPLSYIFAKSQVMYRTQKSDFDLRPTSVIYSRFKLKTGTVLHSGLKQVLYQPVKR